MKRKSGKPQKWEWALSIGLTLSGLLLMLPIFPELLRERLPPVLLSTGSILLVIAILQFFIFKSLPPEEQREREREYRDERNVMISEKAANMVLAGETVGLLVLIVVYGLLFENQAVFQLLVWVNFFRMVGMVLTQWLVGRKY